MPKLAKGRTILMNTRFDFLRRFDVRDSRRWFQRYRIENHRSRRQNHPWRRQRDVRQIHIRCKYGWRVHVSDIRLIFFFFGSSVIRTIHVCKRDYLLQNERFVYVCRYCFVNEKGSMAPKTVMFTMDLGDAPRAPGAPNENEEGHTKLEDMVRMATNFTHPFASIAFLWRVH